MVIVPKGLAAVGVLSGKEIQDLAYLVVFISILMSSILITAIEKEFKPATFFYNKLFSGFIMPKVVDNSAVVSHEEVPDLPEKDEIN